MIDAVLFNRSNFGLVFLLFCSDLSCIKFAIDGLKITLLFRWISKSRGEYWNEWSMVQQTKCFTIIPRAALLLFWSQKTTSLILYLASLSSQKFVPRKRWSTTRKLDSFLSCTSAPATNEFDGCTMHVVQESRGRWMDPIKSFWLMKCNGKPTNQHSNNKKWRGDTSSYWWICA